ncbi:MAG: hypothetical protein C0614_07635 [Desulfuromonas sp.]|nr:MAG: hypothetical protein C0614_07635 [Desulfuromonas sp.]
MSETMTNPETALTPLLKQLISERGAIPFAEYMECCLYHPDYGYYMQPRQRIGKGGDFFTSSSVHALFGKLIARQLIQMAQLLDQPERFQVVEQGAGSGHLALDILNALLREAPELYERLDYCLVDVSSDQRSRQQQLLTGHGERVRWVDKQSWSIASGCFLSNELVDAFPVHLLEKTGGELSEVYVANGEETSGFAEELRPCGAELCDYFAWLGVEPVEGNRAEANLQAPDWMRDVGRRIARGFVLTIDYGYPAEELYAPHRRLGTLLCYRQHQADDNPYLAPGDKDITTHVDFTALQKAGVEVGLSPLWFGEQYRFLLGLGFFEELMQLEAQAEDERQARAVRMTLKNLILPDGGMGETFKVLVQGKEVGQPDLLCARPISAIPLAAAAMR